jgi:hypothetical protein
MIGRKSRELRQAARRYVAAQGATLDWGDGTDAAMVNRFTRMIYKRMKMMFLQAKRSGAV